jgi:hypothetical protein
MAGLNEVKFMLLLFDNLRGNIDFNRSSVPHFAVFALSCHTILWSGLRYISATEMTVLDCTNLLTAILNSVNKLLVSVHKQTLPAYKLRITSRLASSQNRYFMDSL